MVAVELLKGFCVIQCTELLYGSSKTILACLGNVNVNLECPNGLTLWPSFSDHDGYVIGRAIVIHAGKDFE